MQHLSLRNSTQRLCLVIAVLVTAIPLLFLIYRNITIRFVADPRFVVDRETLLAMHRGIPDSPRLNLKLAELFLADAASSEESARMAQKHALDAASRSLWDYRAAY
ncbi:MAG: hypothetical protein EBZ36_12615, partial [Acidobacteria bacterium]|nr:hypothetical protein [Acidobacteriota bacterium]